MNIYELEKKATPGPWRVDKRFSIRGAPMKGQRHVGVTSIGPQMEANAALLKHCRNHFGEALEALKEQNRKLKMYAQNKKPAGSIEWHVAQVQAGQRLIAKLEEVEGV